MEPARSHIAALGAVLLLSSAPARAQRVAKLRPEVRVDAIAARSPTIQAGVGLAQPFGTYTRMVATMAAGIATHDGKLTTAVRTDLTTRFVLDPFWEKIGRASCRERVYVLV